MKRILTILSLAFLISGCEDQLDRAPIDSLINTTAFQSVDDLEAGMVGVYANFNPNNVIEFNSIFTDNVKIGSDNGGQQLNLLNQILDSQNNSGGLWSSRYKTINDANRIIEASDLINPNSNEITRYNYVIGQALAFRAYSHYQLLLYYGEDLLNPGSLGVPYQISVEQDGTPTRLTVGDTKQRIIEDINSAAALIPAGQNNVNFITADFLTFLRANLELVTGGYDQVINLTSDLISKYPLATTEEYLGMFTGDTNTSEVIFSYDNNIAFNRNVANIWIFTGTGGNFVEMGFGLYEALLADDSVRLQVNLAQGEGTDVSNNEFGIGKYPEIGGTYINDVKVMRVSEAYLMRAEAFVRRDQAGGFTNAENDINSIREARGSNLGVASFGSLRDAYEEILNERRLELAFEGTRYIDIKRFRNDLNEGLNRDARDCDGNIPCNIPLNDRRWVFPIPIVETNANPNIQQNPEWIL
jgi:hypothetical protein